MKKVEKCQKKRNKLAQDSEKHKKAETRDAVRRATAKKNATSEGEAKVHKVWRLWDTFFKAEREH